MSLVLAMMALASTPSAEESARLVEQATDFVVEQASIESLAETTEVCGKPFEARPLDQINVYDYWASIRALTLEIKTSPIKRKGIERDCMMWFVGRFEGQLAGMANGYATAPKKNSTEKR